MVFFAFPFLGHVLEPIIVDLKEVGTDLEEVG